MGGRCDGTSRPLRKGRSRPKSGLRGTLRVVAAKKRYPTPPEQMIELAREARREGVPFEVWWARAVRPGEPPITTTSDLTDRPVGTVLWPSDSQDCRTWRDATDGARDGWERAYGNLPAAQRERSLEILGPVLAVSLAA